VKTVVKRDFTSEKHDFAEKFGLYDPHLAVFWGPSSPKKSGNSAPIPLILPKKSFPAFQHFTSENSLNISSGQKNLQKKFKNLLTPAPDLIGCPSRKSGEMVQFETSSPVAELI